MFVVFNMPSKWHPLSVTYHTYVTWLDSCRKNMDPSPTVDRIALQKLEFLTLERAIFTFVQVESFSLGFLLSLCCTFLFFIRLFIAVAAPLKCAKLICLTLFEKADLSHRPLLQASRACQRAHISHCKVKEVLIKGHVSGTTAWADVSVFVKMKESKQENLNCSSHSLTCSISLGFRSLRSSYSSLTYMQE